MAAYREEDRSRLPEFVQHIQVAQTLLNVMADLTIRLREEPKPDPELARSRLESWANLWEQLQQARAIAVGLGRDLSAYDAARARVGDPYLVVAGLAKIQAGMSEAAVEAMNALRAAVPEVVVPAPRSGVPYIPAPSGREVRRAHFHRRMKRALIVRGSMAIAIVVIGFLYAYCKGG